MKPAWQFSPSARTVPRPQGTVAKTSTCGSSHGVLRGEEKKNRDCTYLFVTAENDESTTARLATFGSPQCPERYRSSTVLSEPTFQLTLCRIVRQSTEVQHFASFSQECANVTPCVEWSLQNLGAALWVRGRRTRLLEQ